MHAFRTLLLVKVLTCNNTNIPYLVNSTIIGAYLFNLINKKTFIKENSCYIIQLVIHFNLGLLVRNKIIRRLIIIPF